MANVTFRVRGAAKEIESVLVIGSCDCLGLWRLEAAPKCTHDEVPDADGCFTWTTNVSMEQGINFSYKYLVATPSGLECDKWPRLGILSSTNTLIDDGLLALRRSSTKAMVHHRMTDWKCLSSGTLLRLQFGEVNSPLRKSTVSLLSSDGSGETSSPYSICISPAKANTTLTTSWTVAGTALLTFETKNFSFNIDFKQPTGELIGRTAVSPGAMAKFGTFISAILSPSLEHIGELHIPYLFVTPFQSIPSALSQVPLNVPSLSQSFVPPKLSHTPQNPRERFFRPTLPTLIGHRGSGESVHNFIKANGLVENTLLSFHEASLMGAHFVEFDVQLTSDGIPVVVHDEEILVPVGNSHPSHSTAPHYIQTPVSKLSYSHFSKLVPRMKTLPSDTAPPTPIHKSKSHSWHSLLSTATTQLSTASSVKPKSTTAITQLNYDIPPAIVPPHLFWSHSNTFPSLRELFEFVPRHVGFDLEIKYPCTPQYEKFIAPLDRNTYVDHILTVMLESAHGRPVFISSFDPDVCLLCASKQTAFPVFFLTEGGEGTYEDGRMNSLEAALKLCIEGNLEGIVSDAQALLKNPTFIQQAHACNVCVCSYGSDNTVPDQVRAQLASGLDGICTDSILKIGRSLALPGFV
ncbi:glycerophosphocholine phosphodiesterase [Pelomyxa schiedti]|nr:glycerophosphocholine phosphodiesterase [Pelomyxa schiedti]